MKKAKLQRKQNLRTTNGSISMADLETNEYSFGFFFFSNYGLAECSSSVYSMAPDTFNVKPSVVHNNGEQSKCRTVKKIELSGQKTPMALLRIYLLVTVTQRSLLQIPIGDLTIPSDANNNILSSMQIKTRGKPHLPNPCKVK
ncbi:ATV_HP_G0014950.mRNA.1.CDS.1 [Saccharomyces cerevisiae]|nr:ATV_HP_G0014950.mRNA.1.CDS.1 [Saccharomyces cerevisiae]CAI6949910.1 ATV_HP_G0014950.mRNA.1.CDS.1 [Saccharomyces cerevisiae]